MRREVAVLLSTWNGARFLRDQLDSIAGQRDVSWRLICRDDGSRDDTRAILARFAAEVGSDRCTLIEAPAGRIGAAASFLALLRAVPADMPAAFADQDDVWLPDRLRRGVDAIAAADPARPALHCARQILVDASLRRLGVSDPVRRPPGFAAALAQNVVTGCTATLNPAAVRRVAGSRPPDGTHHDWWCYLVVAASGGAVLADPEPSVLYRQHGGNAVGATPSVARRGVAAMRRGPTPFMTLLRRHVRALSSQPDLLSPEAARELALVAAALEGGLAARLTALRLPGFRRQTALETLVFRGWFMSA